MTDAEPGTDTEEPCMNGEAFSQKLGWRELSPEDREREYSPSSCVDYQLDPYLEAYASHSEASRRWCQDHDFRVRTMPYGEVPSQTIDVVTPGVAGAPLVAFIHGGYWQALSKLDGFGPARDFVGHGCAYASVDYTLAPHASLDQIVAESRMALEKLHQAAPRLGFDPERIFVAGSSAGAHLASMVALDPDRRWQPAGLVLLSGIYELEPLLGTSVNEALSLDRKDAHRNSPSRLAMSAPMPAVVAWGDNETTQFKAQSRLFADQLAHAGARPTLVEATERNHFDIVGDLGDSSSELGSAVVALIDSGAERPKLPRTRGRLQG